MIEIPDIQQSGRSLAFSKVVVKLGSGVIAGADGEIDEGALEAIADSVVALRERGAQVILVSSGAIGMGKLTYPDAPARTIPDRQALAAIGQVGLMHAYKNLFNARGIRVAQILLTRDDMGDRRRYLNARHTIERLLELGALPVINENDTVTIDEIRFGDNDELSALVATKIGAELLVLLSIADGLRRTEAAGRGRKSKLGDVIPLVERIDEEIMAHAAHTTSALGSGGMTSKLNALRLATQAGVHGVLANGKTAGILDAIARGEFTGTYFAPGAPRRLRGKARWLAYGRRPGGKIIVDAGARDALVVRKKSLLPAGIQRVDGPFARGDLVEVIDAKGHAVARGLVNYSAEELEQIKGRKTGQIAEILGQLEYAEAIHRDNMTMVEEA